MKILMIGLLAFTMIGCGVSDDTMHKLLDERSQRIGADVCFPLRLSRVEELAGRYHIYCYDRNGWSVEVVYESK